MLRTREEKHATTIIQVALEQITAKPNNPQNLSGLERKVRTR
jgi:hypothetical protein